MTIRPARSYCFALFGFSGVGKTTVLRYLVDRVGADAVPKYTTRLSRGTAEDSRDFIFCDREHYPYEETITFESYGQLFGIQRGAISESLRHGRSHVLIVGEASVLDTLKSEYGEQIVSLFIYCDRQTLERRLNSDPHRMQRWDAIRAEMSSVYEQLAPVEFVINNSFGEAETHRQIDRLLELLGVLPGNGNSVEGAII